MNDGRRDAVERPPGGEMRRREKRVFATETGRLEAFSDGVLAVIITIMVLELKAPHGVDFSALRPLLPVFAAYVMSFVYIGIYWNNHHHMLRAVDGIDGRSMWLNLHLLFWLSLIPFTTSWIGENYAAPLPTAIYGAVLLACAVAYTLLQHALVAANGERTAFAKALRWDVKGIASPLLYLAAIGFSFRATWIAYVLYTVVAAVWFIPDRRMERAIAEEHGA